MKKMNKKGFTLAELLIVVAIIAILIAIAIPAFGGALDNAKLQTDHANMRSAYAMAQAANLQGVLYTKNASGADVSVDVTLAASLGNYYFMQDGTLVKADNGSAAGNTAYRLKVTAPSTGNPCSTSIACTSNNHTVNYYLYLAVETGGKVSVKTSAT